jgi:hypothetical protein
MPTLLYRTRCPACAKQGRDNSGDNLAVYEDHSYCFSCGYSSFTQNIKSKLKPSVTLDKVFSLPEDITLELPPKAEAWLLKYLPIKQYGLIFWSEEKQSVVFPIRDFNGNTLASISRYFGDDPKHPKWISNNINSNLFHIIGPKSTSICLVEDLVSAIKISKVAQAMPLFGTFIGFSKLARLNLIGITHINIWLDGDKRSEAIVEAKRAMSMGFSVKVIHTDRDPKEHTMEEIEDELSLSVESSIQYKLIQ